jgi:hypothetical protein
MSEAASTSRPSVTLKLATSLDGRIALGNGQSKWITGEAARAEVHRLRAAHDAVIVGSETVLTDDPELTARTDPMPEKQPLRVVADSRGRVPASAKLFSTLEIGTGCDRDAGDGGSRSLAFDARVAVLDAAGGRGIEQCVADRDDEFGAARGRDVDDGRGWRAAGGFFRQGWAGGPDRVVSGAGVAGRRWAAMPGGAGA